MHRGWARSPSLARAGSATSWSGFRAPVGTFGASHLLTPPGRLSLSVRSGQSVADICHGDSSRAPAARRRWSRWWELAKNVPDRGGTQVFSQCDLAGMAANHFA